MYLLWYCDNPKKATAMKVAEAIQAYTDRFKTRPNVVLMNKEELIAVAGAHVVNVIVELNAIEEHLSRVLIADVVL